MNTCSMGIVIRTATTEDAAAIGDFAARVFTENFGHLYQPEDLAAHLVNTCSAAYFEDSMVHDIILLACDGTRIAGYSKIGAVALPLQDAAEQAGEIHRLYIDAPYQGQGLGHQLMQAVLAQPFLRHSAIYLGVWEHNHRAQAMYRRYGFIPVGEYPYYVGQHADREIIMKRSAIPASAAAGKSAN